jgi:hypothetical protein
MDTPRRSLILMCILLVGLATEDVHGQVAFTFKEVPLPPHSGAPGKVGYTRVLAFQDSLLVLFDAGGMASTCIYDPTLKEWTTLRDDSGEEYKPLNITATKDNGLVMSEGKRCVLWAPGDDAVRTVVLPDETWLDGTLNAAASIRGGRVAVYAGNAWYTIDPATLRAESYDNAWPRHSMNGAAPIADLISFEGSEGRLIAGTRMFWTNVIDDSLITIYGMHGTIASTDDGLTWHQSDDGMGLDLYTWSMAPHGSTTVYAVQSYALPPFHFTLPQFYHSTDQGASWQRGWALPSSFYQGAAIHVGIDGTIFISGPDAALSTDKGDSWISVPGPWTTNQETVLLCPVGSHLFALTSTALYVSDDWQTNVSVEDDRVNDQHVRYVDGSIVFERPVDSNDLIIIDVLGRRIGFDRIDNCQLRLHERTSLTALFVIVGRELYPLMTKAWREETH